jgi:hypothetical protein
VFLGVHQLPDRIVQVGGVNITIDDFPEFGIFVFEDFLGDEETVLFGFEVADTGS